MVWSSFTDTVDLFKSALEGNAALKTFCTGRWKKSLTVRKALKLREQVHTAELPIIMITVPSQTSEESTAGLIYREYTVRCYCGFHQTDRVKAQEELIKFEEEIEQVILNDSTLDPVALIQPGDSTNDEGFNHPVYFIVKEFRLLIEQAT